MDASRTLLALDELAKWRERKVRIEERLHQVRVRKRFLLRELEIVQQTMADLGRALVTPGGPPTPVGIPVPPVGVIR